MERKTMIIVAIVIAVVLYWIVAIGASISENPNYKKAREMNQKAQKSYAEGDYQQAYEYAEEAKAHTAKADAYVTMLVQKNKATTLLYQASKRIEAAKAKGAASSFAKQYKQSLADMDMANKTYTAEDYTKSIEYSNRVIDGLTVVVPRDPLPKYYRVRLIKGRRDCFWRIAEYKFIYNNPWKWNVIYDANRQKLNEPDNPNLIFPGQVLMIPSANGEYREGTYDPKKGY
jgi:nucleoid-associated protein YgaU